jgi:hypothetical protein
MRIENPDLSSSTSLCLSTFAQLIKANLNAPVEVESVPSAQKNELVSAIALAIGTGLLTSATYDLLKFAVQQSAARIRATDYILVNHVKIPLKDILSNPSVREAFNEEAQKG